MALNRETIRLITIIVVLAIAFPTIFSALLGSIMQGIVIGAGVAVLVTLIIVWSKSYQENFA